MIAGKNVLHRPGALFVHRGTVSLSGSVYRVLLHLHPNTFDVEIRAMDSFIQNASSLIADTKAQIGTDPKFERLHNALDSFELQVARAIGAKTDLAAKNNMLKELFPSPVSGPEFERRPGLSRPFRQESIANIFGLASYSQIRDLQEWAESAAETSERVVHVVDQQYTFINKTAKKVNQQETRLNQLSKLVIEYATKFKKFTRATSAIERVEVVQNSMLSLLKGSITLLEFTAELRLLLDEELDRARDIIRGRVPLTLFSPHEFRKIMEDARGALPSTYSFSASPTDMALSLTSATITVITKGENSPYFGVLEFPIHRERYDLYQVQAVRVAGVNEPTIMGQYEIGETLVAVINDKYFELKSDQVENCLGGQRQKGKTLTQHYCTAVTSVFTHKPNLRPSSCAASIYFESKFTSEICPQTATLGEGTVFTHIQQNQWAYSSPNPAHMLRVFCLPDGEEAHSSLPLDPNGGLVQIPEGCSGTYGEITLPATYSVQIRFRVSEPVHRPFPRLESDHWRPIMEGSSENSIVINKLRETLRNSTQLKMPMKQFESSMSQIKHEMSRTRFHTIYHGPSFAPALSVSTVAFVVIILLLVVAFRWCRGKRRSTQIPTASASGAALATQEMVPLQAVTGPAGSTPFPAPPIRRPLPAPPLTIREVASGEGDGSDDNMPRDSRRSRRSRRMR